MEKGEHESIDPFDVLHAKFPVLRSMTKDTFVNYTSLLASILRAEETKREDALFNDPYADALTGEAGRAIVSFFPLPSKHGEDGTAYGILRERVIDDEIKENLDPSVGQIVLLGAGMDARCYRFQNLASCHAFEIDSSQDLMEYKQQTLANMNAKAFTKSLTAICMDLSDSGWPSKLEAHGFDRKVPTMWILQGILMHIDEDSVDRLMTAIDQLSAPKSQLLADMCGSGAMKIEVFEDERPENAWSMDTMGRSHRGGVFRALPWNVEMMLQRDSQGNYSGRRWNPVEFARCIVSKEKISFGPMFFASCTKPIQGSSNVEAP